VSHGQIGQKVNTSNKRTIVSYLVFNGTSAHTGYIVPYKYEIYRVGLGGEQEIHIIRQWNKTMNQENHTHFGQGFMEMIPSTRLGFLRGVFLANHLASIDNLTKTTEKTEHIPT